MKVLVANLGSTSFKYRLFDLPQETQLARGGIDRIGQSASACFVEIGGHREESSQAVPDHAAAVRICLEQLMHPQWGCVKSVDEVSAIGFKAVFAGKLSGIRIVDEPLLAKMEELADIAPAHNPMYARAMRQLRSAFPQIPLVASLETAFHETIPDANRCYAVPYEWKTEYEVCRWGFHGASHRYLSTRMSQLLGRNDLRIVTCHLGGSNSLCAVKDGRSLANSLGMSPQTGLPHNNRVGDFDPFALPVLMRATGKSLEQLLQEGVIQALNIRHSGSKVPLLAAVGPLQFEVVQFRLESEYGATSRLESTPWTVVRWLPAGLSEDQLDALSLPTGAKLAYDQANHPVVLFPNDWSANYFSQPNPGITLSALPPNDLLAA